MPALCVVGAWHQAAVSAACFADLGHQVRAIVPDGRQLEAFNRGEPPVYEPGLAEMIAQQVEAGRLAYTADYHTALDGSEAVVVAIDTPVGEDDRPDLGPVLQAVRAIGRAAPEGLLVVVSAQVPVGTCDEIQSLLAREA